MSFKIFYVWQCGLWPSHHKAFLWNNNAPSKLILSQGLVLTAFLIINQHCQGEKDDKIIAVCADDPEYRHFKDIKDLPPHRLQEIRRFFEDCMFLHYIQPHPKLYITRNHLQN